MNEALLFVLAGFVLLYGGGELLVRSAVRLALGFGVSPLLIGLTIVSFATSAPEFAVAVNGALMGYGEVAIGSAVGSNITNIGLILAIAALIRPVRADPGLLGRDAPVMLVVLAAFAFVVHDATISRIDGAVLVGLGVAYGALLLAQSRSSRPTEVPNLSAQPALALPLIGIVAGVSLLAGGGTLFVRGAVTLAEAAGLSTAAISLTVVALGTSLPELAASIVAAARGHGGVAVGNVVGSNIVNLSGVIGTTALVSPLQGGGVGTADLAVVGVASVAFVGMIFQGRSVSRFEGAVLLLGYLAYVVWRLGV